MFVIFLHWFFWRAPSQILRAGRNFLLFGWHFFSIGYFPPRLLAPWHRDLTPYGRGFDLKRFFRIFVWNFISRLIGAILRLCVIVLGFIFEGLVATATLVIFVSWYASPAFSVLLIVVGLGRLTA